MQRITIIPPNSNNSDFYDSCNFIEVPFDDDNHHILVNSKYFNINEMNALKLKENHFGILHLNVWKLMWILLMLKTAIGLVARMMQNE